MTGTYSKNLPRLYHAAQERASYTRKINAKLLREIVFLQMERELLLGKVEKQRELLQLQSHTKENLL